MKKNVLWISNIPTKAFSKVLKSDFNGLWIETLIPFFEKTNDFNLMIVTIGTTSKPILFEQNGIKYCLLPGNSSFKYNKTYKDSIKDWEFVYNNFPPDLLFLWGSECIPSVYAVRFFKTKNIPIALFVQGILNSINRHKNGKISFFDKIMSFSIRDLIKFDFWPFNTFSSIKSINNERYIFNNCNSFFIENNWARDEINKIINYKIKDFYFIELPINEIFFLKHNNRPLSNTKYLKLLSLSINTPLKGCHVVIKAAKLLKDKGIDFKISFTGRNPFHVPFYKTTWYQNYIKRIIKENGLMSQINFLGTLNQIDYAKELMNSNYFISASFCENHSSSVKEAIAVGKPVLSTNVGGISQYFVSGYNGLFFHTNDEYDLTKKIISFINENYPSKSNKINISKSPFYNEIIFEKMVDYYNKILKK